MLMCPVNKGNFCRNGSHFFFTFVSIRPNFINMETINYQAKVNELLGHLSGYGYCAKHLQSFKRECRRIVDYLSVYGTFDGYIQGYSERFGVKLFPARLSIIRLIQCWIEEGRLPSRIHPLRNKETCYERLSDSLRCLVDSYVACCGGGWASSTRYATLHIVSSFLFYLQQCGGEFSAVTEENVWSYFYDTKSDALLRGHGVSAKVRHFLRWAGGSPGGECYARLQTMVPAIKSSSKAYDCLTEEDDRRLTDYVLGDGCGLSLRDTAIFAVARFCGLRACDIAALRMTDVDLAHSRLCVSQRKTGVSLELALRPVVGNAIVHYVMRERPQCSLPELFLVDEREVRPLTPGAVGEVCRKAYRLAGVRRDDCGGGSHLLRHRFAQSLIEGGACDSAAMRLLGHTSPSSLDVYLETDLRRLRDCALSISGFVIGKEVLR